MFCPLLSNCSIFFSLLFMVIVSSFSFLVFFIKAKTWLPKSDWVSFLKNLFPLTSSFSLFYWTGFLSLGFLNLISLVAYSYPVTTTLSFNLGAAFVFWAFNILLMFIKENSISVLVPNNSPWYLISFLSVVELISILVRPITLCFRLLANMSAGHILLSLITKLPFFAWIFGSLFGVLELMVAMVQSFVFLMLVSVYYDEAINHCLSSFWNFTLKK